MAILNSEARIAGRRATSRDESKCLPGRGLHRWIRTGLSFLAGSAALVLSSASGISSVRAQAGSAGEYQLKAAFLFNFAKFVDWPQGNSQAAFALCVLGQDPFGHILDDSLQGKTIANHPVEIRRLKDKTEGRRCRMVFISSSESAHLSGILEGLRGASVLTVGETSGFAAAGGTIEFTIEDNRVRFTINTDAVDRAGLVLSSKLLALATVVHDDGRSKGGG